MAKREAVAFTTPVARLVWGDVYTARPKTETNGAAKLIRSGADMGKPLHMVEFGIAIPKTQAHWANEPDWGQKIWAEGHASWPGGQTGRPDFSWKVTDGDSTVPNTKGKRPADLEHNRGHWLLAFSGMTPPEIWNSTSGQVVRDATPELIMPGDEVQVFGSVSGNGSDLKPGMYLNHGGVCWRGRSAKGRISVGPQVDPSGFGAGLAPGATAMAPALAAPIPGAPAAPTPPVPTPAAPPAAPAAVAPAPVAAPVPVAVAPNPAYTPTGVVPPAPGTAPTPPAPPAPPAAPAGPVMSAAATAAGYTYDMLKTAGWGDQQMRDAGYLA